MHADRALVEPEKNPSNLKCSIHAAVVSNQINQIFLRG